jgi:hypothetical protein
MDLSLIPIPVFLMVGAVLAAFVTGLITLTTLIVSKEDKVTDSRQKWLEDLRSETANLLAVVDTLVRLVEPDVKKRAKDNLHGLADADLSDFRKKYPDLYKSLNEMHFRVLLRLDPVRHRDAETHERIIKAIEELNIAFYGPCTQGDLEKIGKLRDAIIRDTQEAIRSAWERVKQGETGFSVLREVLRFGAAILFILIIVGFLYAVFTRRPATTTATQAPATNAVGQPGAPAKQAPLPGGAKSP